MDKYNTESNREYLQRKSYQMTEKEEQERLEFCFALVEDAIDGTIILREIIDQALLIIRGATS
jgi:hypothetical protein